MFCVDKIKCEHLLILSNLKSCQFAPRIVIFTLCIRCQFEDSHIISPKKGAPTLFFFLLNFFLARFSRNGVGVSSYITNLYNKQKNK